MLHKERAKNGSSRPVCSETPGVQGVTWSNSSGSHSGEQSSRERVPPISGIERIVEDSPTG